MTGRTDGLFAHAFESSHLPKVFYTNTGYEYWGRAGALIHVSVDGSSDIEPFANERIYHFASGQHFVSGFPPRRPMWEAPEGPAIYRGNPLDFLYSLRALLVRMVEWVRDGEAPPNSQYPRIDEDELAPLAQWIFPSIPQLKPPEVAHEAYRVEYGLRWDDGIIDVQPPRLGPVFPTLVPRVDEFGNEFGGVGSVEILAPLATYAPWNLRHGAPANEHELTDFYGTFIPLPRTEQEREMTHDPRPSVESLYESREAYLEKAEAVARSLVGQGFLMEEDAPRVLERAARHWDWLMGG